MWERYPSLRLFISLCLGILCANFIDVNPFLGQLILAISLFLGLFLGLYKRLFDSYSKNIFFGISISFFFFSLGIVLSHQYSEKYHNLHYTKSSYDKGVVYALEIIEQPIEKPKSLKTEARILSVLAGDSIAAIQGKVLLYFQKDSASENLNYGDKILYRGKFSTVKTPQNPFEFDYRNYLHLKAIYAQAYVASNTWKVKDVGGGFFLKRWSVSIRKKLLQKIEGWNLSPNENTVTKALLLGYRYEIDGDLLQAYASAGATHVLAVSGLHVGIVYLLTSYLLFFLKYMRYGSSIKTIILVLLLWSYALITGLSPSVVRAATMFTFVALGTGFSRETSIYNTIIASAMVLLLIKPTYLFEVGFQLSYLAVFGIVWLQPKFQSILTPKYWILKQIWGIITVSIAAQLATFPLGLYYFHQFPGLFLVSNLIVIPLISILMYSGLFALGLASAGIMVWPLIGVYNFFLKLMNGSVQMVEGMAVFLWDKIHISRLELVLLYLILVLLFQWAFMGKIRRLKAALGLCILMMAFQVYENYQLVKEKHLTFYAIKNQSAIGYHNGSEYYLWADSSLLANDAAMTFHIKHHIWALNTKSINLFSDEEFCARKVCKKSNVIAFEDYKVAVLEEGKVSFPLANIWYITNKNLEPPITAKQKPQTVVFTNFIETDESSQDWRQWAQSNGVKIVALNKEGYYQLSTL